jgi:RHH-type proline utilization regulon transcriptional repressor/proline dehydrogenase/delta 1-pyrroline-5-carboxylate dehydrogenase
MIVDSSALAEHVVVDVLASAFDSAGQRCSSLRLLYLQADIADRLLAILTGAMAELTIGDLALIATNVGPVIDAPAHDALERHAQRMTREGRLLYLCALPAGTEHGTYFAPRAFEIDSARLLPGEVFGPILHVIRWPGDRLDEVIAEIAATGYGLTLGIQSRMDETVRYILARVAVGNSYVNRNMIGAVVGCSPFGGEALSGTGPKAGGPRYLHRFATDRTVSTDATAAGRRLIPMLQRKKQGKILRSAEKAPLGANRGAQNQLLQANSLLGGTAEVFGPAEELFRRAREIQRNSRSARDRDDVAPSAQRLRRRR